MCLLSIPHKIYKAIKAVVHAIAIIAMILAATAILVLALVNVAQDRFFVAAILMISSTSHFTIFVLGGGIKNPFKYPEILFYIACVAFSIVLFVTDAIPLGTICIIWGAFDIVRSAYHMLVSFLEFKHNKWEFIEICVDIVEIVFGILLIIEHEAGIMMHVIVMSSAYYVTAGKFLIDYFHMIKD